MIQAEQMEDVINELKENPQFLRGSRPAQLKSKAASQDSSKESSRDSSKHTGHESSKQSSKASKQAEPQGQADGETAQPSAGVAAEATKSKGVMSEGAKRAEEDKGSEASQATAKISGSSHTTEKNSEPGQTTAKGKEGELQSGALSEGTVPEEQGLTKTDVPGEKRRRSGASRARATVQGHESDVSVSSLFAFHSLKTLPQTLAYNL